MIFPRNKRPKTGSLLSSFIRPLLRRWGEKAKPQRQGTIFLPGLKETVKVVWSRHAIPHLHATSEHDLFMAQGYIHAQDRLWQMDSSRMLLKGRTAEIYGKRTIPWKEVSVHFKDKTTIDLDYFIRLLGIHRTASASLSQLPEEFVKFLVAYSEGVNRYIENHLKALPVEFRLLRYEPEPWKPEDCLVIGKGFAFFLSTSLFTRLTMTLLAARLPNQQTKLKSLYPSYPEGNPFITRRDLTSTAEVSGEILRFLNGTFSESGWSPARQGSNSWVVAPSRSTTGRAILCNDPHLRMALPSTWYLIHLQAASNGEGRDGYEVWGASIPGSPCIHLGHNRWISWGVTAAVCDDGDLYREKVQPGDPDHYLVEEQWCKMNRHEEKIRIRGGREVIKWTRFTRHGPVISDVLTKDLADEVLAFQWTAHDPSQEFRALYGVNRASDWNEFLQSLSHQVAPSLNYVYADAQGNIGYSLAGRIPIRHNSSSFLPLPGWSRHYDWKGYISFDKLPRLYNPPEGIVATANNRIADASYPYHLSDLFDPPYRIRRIKELLTAKPKLSFEDMAQIQRDVVSLHGGEIIAILRSDLDDIVERDASLKDPIGRLIQWDGGCSETSIEASLFHVFYQRLTANLLTHDLGEQLFLSYIEIFNQSLTPLAEILADPQSPWFASQPRLALVQTSLRDAVAELTVRFGADPNRWCWGKLHTLILRHPFGRSKILEPLFSIGPFPSPGDGVTINMGFYRSSDPYQQFVGPSLRMIIDGGDWSSSRFIIPSGQAGDAFSPHYRDQTELWRRGEYISLSQDDEGRNEWCLLTLTPAGTHS